MSDYEAKQFNRRISPYVSGLETYVCDHISEAYMEAYERKMYFLNKGDAAEPYDMITKDMKRFMRKHCTWQLESLEEEIDADRFSEGTRRHIAKRLL